MLDVNWLLLFKSSLWIPYQSGHHPILRFANNNWNWEDCIFCFLHVSLVRVKVDPIIFPIFKKILFQNKGNIWNWSILQFDHCTALVDKSWKISSECSLEKYLLFPLACWTLSHIMWSTFSLVKMIVKLKCSQNNLVGSPFQTDSYIFQAHF